MMVCKFIFILILVIMVLPESNIISTVFKYRHSHNYQALFNRRDVVISIGWMFLSIADLIDLIMIHLNGSNFGANLISIIVIIMGVSYYWYQIKLKIRNN